MTINKEEGGRRMARQSWRKILRAVGLTSTPPPVEEKTPPKRHERTGTIKLPIEANEIYLILPSTWRPPEKTWILTVPDAKDAFGQTPTVVSWPYSGIVENHYQYVLGLDNDASHVLEPLTFSKPVRTVEISIVDWQKTARENDVPSRIPWHASTESGRQVAGWLDLA
ncbi:hypothetical protein EJ997_03190 [Flaviflexus ciconiae]|uniref:Uncharacterized protein n=1 Tax=Flaviflexus ciconiae TaxID=2496867 RepID=A0A3S9PVT9_9ACTO|nr:hypothetical protein [Flaviflexus ciconiae]AZQ76493.1 hypothetical protein EJ997_03190 [Flaviflexus ciconiae]